MAHMRMQGFIREEFDAHYLVAEKIADVPAILERAWDIGGARGADRVFSMRREIAR